jgi:FkbM family methyltransferase
VIHVGANTGQEQHHYASFGLNVLWIEPIPAVFEELRSNISGFPNQSALCYLLAAEDVTEYTFHVANNGGASSSIFDFAEHRKVWPDVCYTHDLRLAATTLARLIDIERINPSQLCGAGPRYTGFRVVGPERCDSRARAFSVCQDGSRQFRILHRMLPTGGPY